LGDRKGIRPVKTEWWGAGVVIYLERGADLHMVPDHTGSPGKRAVKRVCVCECGLVFGFCRALCWCGEGRAAIKGYLLPAAPTAANPLHNVAAGEWDGQTKCRT